MSVPCYCGVGLGGDTDCPLHGSPTHGDCQCSVGIFGDSECPIHRPQAGESPAQREARLRAWEKRVNRNF